MIHVHEMLQERRAKRQIKKWILLTANIFILWFVLMNILTSLFIIKAYGG